MNAARDFSAIHSFVERRRAERHPTHIEATLMEMGRLRSHAVVRDISADGFMCESGATHLVGGRVWLLLAPDGAFPARVVWCRDGLWGCEFLRPLGDVDLACALSQCLAAPAD